MAKSTVKPLRTVSVRLDGESFNQLTTITKVKGTTMGAVIREAIKQHASALMDDPSWIDEVEDLQRRLEPLLPPRR